MRQGATRHLALLWAVSLCVPRASGAQARTFELEVSECGGDRGSLATGFVVRDDWLRRDGRMLLLTALHAVYGCAEVRMKRVNCQGEDEGLEPPLTASVPVHVWKSHDLIAIELPEPLARAVRPDEVHAIGWRDEAPSRGDDLFVDGRTKGQVCMEGRESQTMFPVSARKLSTQVAATHQWTVSATQGYLGDETKLLNYAPGAGPGASGGPVYRAPGAAGPASERKAPRVIAVHHAGVEHRIGWAVLLAGGGLEKAKRHDVTLGTVPPGWRKPLLGQASHDLLPEEVREVTGRRTDWHVEVSAEVPVSTERYPSYLLWLHFGRSREFLPSVPDDEPQRRARNVTFGVRASGGPFFAGRRQYFVAPNGALLEHLDRMEGGAFAELDLELNLRRLARVRITPLLGGRFGFAIARTPAGYDYWLLGGAALRLRAAIALVGYEALFVEAGALYERQTPVVLHYDVVTGDSTLREAAWGFTASLGVGVEF